jgi:hypothetical protein
MCRLIAPAIAFCCCLLLLLPAAVKKLAVAVRDLYKITLAVLYWGRKNLATTHASNAFSK